jgi:hypothetical protein
MSNVKHDDDDERKYRSFNVLIYSLENDRNIIFKITINYFLFFIVYI